MIFYDYTARYFVRIIIVIVGILLFLRLIRMTFNDYTARHCVGIIFFVVGILLFLTLAVAIAYIAFAFGLTFLFVILIWVPVMLF